jgi:hypothetical protein
VNNARKCSSQISICPFHSLWLLIRLQRIHNFLMLHACFYTICLVFRYTSWHFYAFSGTNLLTSRHSASSLFSAIFCVSEKLHRKYSRNWMKQVSELLFFPDEGRGPKESRRGARDQPHTRAVRPSPWSRPLCVRSPWQPPDDAPSPI